jgi:hypothetical protein
MKINEIFDKASQEYIKRQPFVRILADEKVKVSEKYQHEMTTLGMATLADLSAIYTPRDPFHTGNFWVFIFIIQGHLGETPMNFHDLYDGDTDLDIPKNYPWQANKETLKKALKELFEKYKTHGLEFISPTSSDERIQVDKFDILTHLTTYEADEADEETVSFDDTWRLWFRKPADQIEEAVDTTAFVKRIQDAGTTDIDAFNDSELWDAITEGERIDLETGFWYQMDLSMTFSQLNIASLYDGNREEMRKLLNRTKDHGGGFSQDAWDRFTFVFYRMVDRWKKMGLVSMTLKAKNQDSHYVLQSSDYAAYLRWRGLGLYLLKSINTKMGMDIKIVLRFPPQK